MHGILLPVLLYPALLWVEASALVFVTGLAERTPARLAVEDPPGAHAALLDSLRARGAEILSVPSAEALALLREGRVDAVVAFPPAGDEAAALPDNFRVFVRYDGAVARSRRARDRVEGAVEGYREAWTLREATLRAVPRASVAPFEVRLANVSSREDVATELLSLTIPLFLVIAVALGCLVPAVDTTAGERERGTWETLLSTGATRTELVAAKYLHVAAFGAAAGVLNATAMTVVVGPVLGSLGLGEPGPGGAGAFTLSGSTWLVMVGGAALLALFFAAIMMLLAGFARTFKDGQAMVTPVFYLALLPLLLGRSPERTLTPALALLPVANVAMAIRDAIRGIFLWPLVLLALATSLVLVVLCLRLAADLLGREDFVLGTHRGGPLAFLRDRRRRR